MVPPASLDESRLEANTKKGAQLIPSKKTLIDLAERSLATFAQAFLASVTIGHTVVPAITDLRALELAAVAGGYSVGKFLLVKANAYLANANAAPKASGPAAP